MVNVIVGDDDGVVVGDLENDEDDEKVVDVKKVVKPLVSLK